MKKKIIGIISVVLMLFSVFAGAHVNVQKGLKSADIISGSIQITVNIGEYQVQDTNQGVRISIEDFGHLFIPGKPCLPSRIVSIAIPPGSEFVDFSYDIIEMERLSGFYYVEPTPLARVIGEEDPYILRQNQIEYQENYNQAYHGKEIYPSSVVELERRAGYRNYNLVDMRINPFSYHPRSGELEFFSEIEISINYRINEEINNLHIIKDDSKYIEKTSERIIYNYEQTKNWYETSSKTRDSIEFVIITTSTLESKLTDLVNWEEAKGKDVEIVTTTWIDSNYDGYDLAEKIRNFLRDKYPSNEWGIEDVLLVGDYDDVPMRRCAQDLGYGSPETDFYYAELSLPDSESWDADGDHNYGEDSDPIDFYSEVNVGRIPWTSSSTVEHICEKTVGYEQNSDSSFKKNILLLGAYFWPDTDNAELMEEKIDKDWMSDWTMTKMYEQGHSTYPSDYDLSYSNVKSVWSSGKYAFVNWAGHGSPTGCYIYYSSGPFVDTDTCDSLNDEYPAIVFADACSNSDTDHLNLGKAMLKQGAVGFVGATKVAFGRPGWDSPYDGSSQSMDYFFTTKVTSGEYTQGQAHQWALLEMYTNSLWYYNKYETFEWGALWGNPDLAMKPPLITIKFPEGLPEFVDPGVPTNISVEIFENTDNYIPGSAKLYFRNNGGTYQESFLEHINGSLYRATLPPAYCGQTAEFYFSVEGEEAGTIYSPFNAPNTVYSSIVGNFITFFTDNFETNKGWTVENDSNLTEGSWERGIPVGGGDRGDPLIDNDGSGQCFLTMNIDGDSDVDDGITWLISPKFDLSSGENFIVNYALWYTNDHGHDPDNDYFKVYVSEDNGANWVLAETIGPESSAGWKEHSFAIGDFINPSNRVRIRFEASDLNDISVVEAGIDSFLISILECDNPPMPDLCCNGELKWRDIKPGENVSGTFEIENCGDPDTLLSWQIQTPTSWGTWSFSPDHGTDLRPQDGPVTINVEVIAPSKSDTEYIEKIFVYNPEDSVDICEVDVVLKTPKTYNFYNIGLLSAHFQNFPLIRLLLYLFTN